MHFCTLEIKCVKKAPFENATSSLSSWKLGVKKSVTDFPKTLSFGPIPHIAGSIKRIKSHCFQK